MVVTCRGGGGGHTGGRAGWFWQAEAAAAAALSTPDPSPNPSPTFLARAPRRCLCRRAVRGCGLPLVHDPGAGKELCR